MDIRDKISKLSLRDSTKLNVYNIAMKPYWYIKSLTDPLGNYKQYLRCFLHQNSYYGHEYWLRKYASYNKPIYSLIEHGIALEDDISLMGWEAEWGVGSALTFGEYRKNMLQSFFSEHLIVPIGPRLHYAEMDKGYYDELNRKIDKNSRTIVLYPSHSLERGAYDYDLDLFYKNAVSFAKDNKINNILVSLHPSDVLCGFAERYQAKDKNIVVVSGGTENVKFLPRLKAILSIADITYSNKFGTHVGYSLYMGKPHIIETSSDVDSEANHAKFYKIEENGVMLEHEAKFNKMFNGKDPWVISNEQREFADYYFGFSHVKTPKEMFETLQKCRNNYLENFR